MNLIRIITEAIGHSKWQNEVEWTYEELAVNHFMFDLDYTVGFTIRGSFSYPTHNDPGDSPEVEYQVTSIVRINKVVLPSGKAREDVPVTPYLNERLCAVLQKKLEANDRETTQYILDNMEEPEAYEDDDARYQRRL